MFAVKETNLNAAGNPSHYIPAKDYADACQIVRTERESMKPYWTEGTDFTIEVVEVPSDFDFADQPDWN